MFSRLTKLFVCCLLFVAPGCNKEAQQAVVEYLPKIVQYIQDAQLVIDQIDAAAQPIFALKADEALKQEYAKKLALVRSSLQVAIRTSKGGQALTLGEVDAAFTEFRSAYTQLKQLLEASGVQVNGVMGAAAGGVAIPEPLAMGI